MQSVQEDHELKTHLTCKAESGSGGALCVGRHACLYHQTSARQLSHKAQDVVCGKSRGSFGRNELHIITGVSLRQGWVTDDGQKSAVSVILVGIRVFAFQDCNHD